MEHLLLADIIFQRSQFTTRSIGIAIPVTGTYQQATERHDEKRTQSDVGRAVELTTNRFSSDFANKNNIHIRIT